jgi:hypothetical protein
MIAPESFLPEWLNSHRQERQYAKINPPVLEKMIYALALVEALVRNGLKFTFKGGTSLVLLLPEPRRFSVDIDIQTTHTKADLEVAFNTLAEEGRFTRWELDSARSYQEGVPKAHYFFYYDSQLNKDASYVLFETHRYPVVITPPIQSNWIVVDGDALTVETPSIESILGDKLTAFAPNTTGVPFGKNKSLEIIKQLHDVGHLFDHAEDIQIVTTAFYGIVEQEIYYRGLRASPEKVLDDIISTSLLIGQTVKHHQGDEIVKYHEITRGIVQFGNFLMTGSYRIDDAIESAAKAAYLAAKIKAKNSEPFVRYDGSEIDFQFEKMPHNNLNRLRKIRNGSLYYWARTSELLGIK